jgi:hypothetical protein
METKKIYYILSKLDSAELFTFISDILSDDTEIYVFRYSENNKLTLRYKTSLLIIYRDREITISLKLSINKTHYYIYEKSRGYLCQITLEKMCRCIRKTKLSSILQ